MTNQEIFDKVAKHLLLSQREKSAGYVEKNGGDTCRYRIQKENRVLMCAAGIFIKDEDYSESLEGNSIDKHIVSSLFLKYGFTDDNISFLQKLQEIHDGFTVSEWAYRLCRLAEEYNLKTERTESHDSNGERKSSACHRPAY